VRKVALAAFALAGVAEAAPRLIGITTLPPTSADGLAVGGLSGIDYDARTGTYVAISDDRSEHGPARAWRIAIDHRRGDQPSARLIAPISLRDRNGDPYPPPGRGREALDAEAIRVVPGGLLWSSEGDAKDGFGPAVRLSNAAGTLIRALTLPAMFRFDPTGQTGPRPNLSIEGLSPTGSSLWIGMEAPLFQDGPVASPDAGADVRLSRIDRTSGRLLGQYAYRVEPIGWAASGRLADNGVSEVLAIDERHLLVVERSGRQQPDGDFRYVARLWCASVTGATDVAHFASLKDQPYRVMRKRLVFDFSKGPQRIDSVEGMSWAPPLANGHAALVFVTDNDFSPQRDNQVIVLDAGVPRRAASTLCGH